MARDSGRRRNTHALDAQACDLIELPSRAAKPTVRSPRVRAERAPADCAAVPLPSAGLGRKRAVAHDVKARLSTVVTPGGSARHPIGRVHGSSVPAGETPRVPHDCRGAADRSTANGASTRSPASNAPSRPPGPPSGTCHPTARTSIPSSSASRSSRPSFAPLAVAAPRRSGRSSASAWRTSALTNAATIFGTAGTRPPHGHEKRFRTAAAARRRCEAHPR